MRRLLEVTAHLLPERLLPGLGLSRGQTAPDSAGELLASLYVGAHQLSRSRLPPSRIVRPWYLGA